MHFQIQVGQFLNQGKNATLSVAFLFGIFLVENENASVKKLMHQFHYVKNKMGFLKHVINLIGFYSYGFKPV
jgi:hypothetical protein